MTTIKKKARIFAIACLSIMAVGSTMFIACTDEDDILNGSRKDKVSLPQKVSSAGISINIFSQNIDTTNFTMLEFQSSNDFFAVYDMLTNIQDEYEDNIINTALTTVDTSVVKFFLNDDLGIDDYMAMKDFEQSIGFTNSMRVEYEKAEKEWLAQEYDSDNDVSFDNHPSNLFPFDDATLALLNSRGEVKIGDTIFRYTNNGYVAITDGDLLTLSTFNKGYEDISQYPNVIYQINQNSSQTECKTSGHTCENYIELLYGIVKIRHHFSIKFRTQLSIRAATSANVWSYATLKNEKTGKVKERKISGVKTEVGAYTHYYGDYCSPTIVTKKEIKTGKKHHIAAHNYKSPIPGIPTPLKYKPKESISATLVYNNNFIDELYLK